jgi:beta-N-acetylhexosaminidase
MRQVLRDHLHEAPSPRLVAIVAVVLVLGATAVGALIGGGGQKAAPVPEAGRQSNEERRTSFLARIIPPEASAEASAEAGVPKSVAELAKRLPADRKVAQLFLVGFQGRDLNAPIYRQLRRLDLGGIVIGSQNYTDPQQLAALAGEAGVVARKERHVPPWVMATQEGGEFSDFADLPPATAASDLATVGQATDEARATGRSLRRLGVNGVLGPVVDVGLENDLAIGARAFSDDPELVASYAAALVRTYRDKRVFAAVKHFPGLGSASQSTEAGPANVGLSLDELANRDLVAFRAAFRAGAPGVVISNGLYAPDDFILPGSLSKSITTDLLREELRFEGIAITDDLADPSVTALGTVPDAAVQAVKAGADMVQISGSPGDQQAAYVAVLRAVRSGEIPPERLDEAVLRVLNGKRDYGLIR